MPAIRTPIQFFAAVIPTLILLLPISGPAADESNASNLPSPLRITIGQTLQLEEENRPAEVVGQVTFVGKERRAVYLEISSDAGSMPVNIANGTGFLTDLLLRSRIRARGICTAIHSSADRKIVGGLLVSNL